MATAHWAHVGGFVFGAVTALGLRYSGLEHHANKAIEAKVGWTAEGGFIHGTEQMEQGELDGVTLNGYLASKPNSTEGYTLLQQIYWRKMISLPIATPPSNLPTSPPCA